MIFDDIQKEIDQLQSKYDSAKNCPGYRAYLAAWINELTDRLNALKQFQVKP